MGIILLIFISILVVMLGNLVINENDFEELVRVSRWGFGGGIMFLSFVIFFGIIGINFVVVLFVGNVG